MSYAPHQFYDNGLRAIMRLRLMLETFGADPEPGKLSEVIAALMLAYKESRLTVAVTAPARFMVQGVGCRLRLVQNGDTHPPGFKGYDKTPADPKLLARHWTHDAGSLLLELADDAGRRPYMDSAYGEDLGKFLDRGLSADERKAAHAHIRDLAAVLCHAFIVDTAEKRHLFTA